MDEIAAGAGVVRSTLYVYFPNRTALLVGCIAAMYAQMTASLEEGDVRPPAAELEQLMTALFTTIDEDPIFFRLAMAIQSAPGADGAAVSAQIGGIGDEVNARVVRLLAEGNERGDWSLSDPEATAALIGQQIYGALAVRSGARGSRPPAAAAREVVELLVHGLAGATAERPTSSHR